MALTDTDKYLLSTIGQRRMAAAKELEKLKTRRELEDTIAECDAAMKAIDPTVPSWAEVQEGERLRRRGQTVEFVVGDNPATPEVEVSWWRRVVRAVTGS